MVDWWWFGGYIVVIRDLDAGLFILGDMILYSMDMMLISHVLGMFPLAICCCSFKQINRLNRPILWWHGQSGILSLHSEAEVEKAWWNRWSITCQRRDLRSISRFLGVWKERNRAGGIWQQWMMDAISSGFAVEDDRDAKDGNSLDMSAHCARTASTREPRKQKLGWPWFNSLVLNV